jgi:hypothetical protein
MNRRNFFLTAGSLAASSVVPVAETGAVNPTIEKLSEGGVIRCVSGRGKSVSGWWSNVQTLKLDRDRMCFVNDGPPKWEWIEIYGPTLGLLPQKYPGPKYHG